MFEHFRVKDQGCRTVNVHCSRTGDLGVFLRGGRGHGIFILSLTPESPAAVCGLLHNGDEIVRVSLDTVAVVKRVYNGLLMSHL